MAGPMDEADETLLWQRWRAAVGGGPGAPQEPDALTLAAYVEDRLSPAAAAEVEAWVAANPAAMHDILAARQLREAPLPVAPEAVAARAMALLGAAGAQVLPFIRRPARRLGLRSGAVGWAAMAASIVLASLAGFATGKDTYLTLAGSSPPSLGQEVLDPPMGMFNGYDEDSNI